MISEAGQSLNRLRAAYRLLAPGVQMPVYLIVFVTSRCDARCRHCFYWRELNHVPNELTVDEYDRLARAAGPTFQVTLTGGSPELRSDLPAIAMRFHEHCRPVNMTLCLLGRHTEKVLRQVETILDECPNQRLTVGLSLDGLNAEHDNIRGCPGLFDRVRATFQGLGELKKRYSRLTLNAAVTISTLNQDSAERTARWAWDNLPIDGLKPILVRGTPADPTVVSETSREPYLRLVALDRARTAEAPRRRATVVSAMIAAKESVERELIEEIITTEAAPVGCSGGRETAIIFPDGKVAGCELRNDVLGYLRESELDLRRVWLSNAATQFRATAGLLDVCKGCYHHCFLSPAMFRSPRLWPRLARSFLLAIGKDRRPMGQSK